MNHRRGPIAGGILGFPPAISQLVLINAIIFLIQKLLPEALFVPNGLGLIARDIVTKGRVWELVTYMFLHGSVLHILLNMFYLVMFGSDLERWWGSRVTASYAQHWRMSSDGRNWCRSTPTSWSRRGNWGSVWETRREGVRT